jgi:hypothetical protein
VDSKFAFLPEGEITWDTEPPVKPGPDGLYPVPIPGKTSLASQFAALGRGHTMYRNGEVVEGPKPRII